ncbi:MAG: hypothetical protein HY958_03425 [Bacteroidia bacterium]|nr:hypothetical protein [Bacteroidia bacterium]
MKHRGEIIEKAVRESGMSITELARRLKRSRRHIYNIFNESTVDIDTILQIGNIIRRDFRKDIPDIARYTADAHKNSAVKEGGELYKNAEYWREKYFELLEKYNALLEKVSVKGIGGSRYKGIRK